MKFLLSWLREYIDLEHSASELAAVLTMAGLEVEGCEELEGEGDYLFEVAITPNLGHCASVVGIARELSALLEKPLRLPSCVVKESSLLSIDPKVKVEVKEPTLCPRYCCRLVVNIPKVSSPEWLQKRLIAVGQRSINVLVDIVNYVSLETGQPLHAFDFDKLQGPVVVRAAVDGEKINTLDGKERLLNKPQLLICDGQEPIAIAGVMGGADSEVSEETTSILLESAYFDPRSIRKTSKAQALMTDASKLFERGVDPNQQLFALDRAMQLIQSIAGGEVAKGAIDLKARKFPEKQLTCRLSRVNALLGIQFSLSEVEAIFQKLNFSPRVDQQGEQLIVKVPTYRVDIGEEIDLIEEVVRLYGYNNIPQKEPLFQSSQLPHAPLFLFEKEIRSRLIAEGLQEFITCDLISPSAVAMTKEQTLPEEALIKVLNPMSSEQSILRFSMLPGLLALAKYNEDHGNSNVSGFEVGKIHFKKEEQYQEQSTLGILLMGKAALYDWDLKARDVDFYDLKGIIENLLKGLRIENGRFKENAIHTFHTGRQAAIFVGTLAVGSLGEIHPRIQRQLDLSQRLFYAELNIQDLFKVRKETWKMQPLPLYPGSERDWTVTLKEETPMSDLFDLIYKAATPLLEEVYLLDIYRSQKVGKERKNVTLRFVYRDKAKTMEQSSVDLEHERMIQAVSSALGKVLI